MPWPASVLGPNRERSAPWQAIRGRDRSGRATGAATLQRDEAAMLAKAWRAANGWESVWPPAELVMYFAPPDRRKRDVANLIHAMKAAIDGLVDAGLLGGDDGKRLPIVTGCLVAPEKPGKVTMELREIGERDA
jgi:hypothetical protein